MDRYVLDLETNGLLPEATTVHCAVVRSVERDDEVTAFRPDGLHKLVPYIREILKKDTQLVGHNIIGFDLPILVKLDYISHQDLVDWTKQDKVVDTLSLSHLKFPDIAASIDFGRTRKLKDFPAKLIGKHSLEAWGWRIGKRKGDFGKTQDWAAFSEEMLDYCIQDTAVTAELYRRLVAVSGSTTSVVLEARFFEIIEHQMRHGFAFDKGAADRMLRELQVAKAALKDEIERTFLPFEETYITPKKKIQKTKIIPFNPSSRQHIEKALRQRHQWQPTEFTESGQAELSEETLKALPYPEAKMLCRWFLVDKRLGQLAEGKQAWMKAVKPDGRIHGYVNSNGAVTGRCTHSSPNVAQVPRVRMGKVGEEKRPLLGEAGGWGWEARSCFRAVPGMRLVGFDASGLELRCLAHYMSFFDGGKYAKLLVEDDIHTVNMKAAGLTDRDQAKTFIYAFLYGAGDEKLGLVVGGTAKDGHRLKTAFLKKTPALALLKNNIIIRLSQRGGTLLGLDKRVLPVRSGHAALNTLLQSAGAILMKQAAVNLYDKLSAHGLIRAEPWLPSYDYAFVANIHDEVQLEVQESSAVLVGEAGVASVKEAGTQFDFRCPLDASYKIGNSWAETH